MNINSRVFLGSSLKDGNIPSPKQSPVVNLPGTFGVSHMNLSIDEDILSKHILFIGGTGCGKTNTFYYFVDQIKKKMTNNDVMIIFDTKGDFYKKFYSPSEDKVLSNSKQYLPVTDKWNVFKEISADGWDDIDIVNNTNELTMSVFQEAIQKNSSNPFFPNAARDLLAALIICITRAGVNDALFRKKHFYNKELRDFLNVADAVTIANMLKGENDMGAVLNYIGDGTTAQALGVLAEMQNVIRQIFVGSFADAGHFSIRNFVRNKGGKTLFVEYDLSMGSLLTPIYRLFFDLALKEALGRNKSEGNVYLICDEFKLLPNLQHIDDGVNFGRSLGVKVLAGLQSIEQLYEIYGDSRGRNIAAGFSAVFAFKANDPCTREYVSKLYGKNIMLEQYQLADNSYVEEKRDGNTVEDWDLNELEVGEAIVGLPFQKPFKYKVDIFR